MQGVLPKPISTKRLLSFPTCILQTRAAVLPLLPRSGHLLLVLGQEHLRHGGGLGCPTWWPLKWSLRWSCPVAGVVVVCLQVGGRAATEEVRMGRRGWRMDPHVASSLSPSLLLSLLLLSHLPPETTAAAASSLGRARAHCL